MKNIQKKEIYIKSDNMSNKLFDADSIFFDIETTGFSPSHAHIYMIGCAYKKSEYIYINQYFAEDSSEEKEIIEKFTEFLTSFKSIISFNGIGFDIPFLKAKCDQYKIKNSFDEFEYVDIFKIISPIKPILNLENYKQKTIEKFIGLKRDDNYNGGELINVYHEYVKSRDENALELLLLHNYEDILGMTELLPILSYVEIFNGNYAVSETKIDTYKAMNGMFKKEFIITLKNDTPVPVNISTRYKDIYLAIKTNNTILRIPVYEGELHYFYTNYKDYYYLPAEDMAIHKSVASFVDKEYKERCRAYNCYNRKTSEFLVQYENIMNPEFKDDYKDKNSYFELTEDFSSSDIMLRRYVDHLLRLLLKK